MPREMPEAYNQGQGLNPTVVDRMPDDVSAYFVIVAEEDGKLENVTDRAASMKGDSGKFYLYAKTQYQPSPWYAGGPYVDLLAQGVTDKFMEITMKGYEQTFGGDLKGNVKGIFTDEPEIVSPGGVRWTPDLFDVFHVRIPFSSLYPWPQTTFKYRGSAGSISIFSRRWRMWTATVFSLPKGASLHTLR